MNKQDSDRLDMILEMLYECKAMLTEGEFGSKSTLRSRDPEGRILDELVDIKPALREYVQDRNLRREIAEKHRQMAPLRDKLESGLAVITATKAHGLAEVTKALHERESETGSIISDEDTVSVADEMRDIISSAPDHVVHKGFTDYGMDVEHRRNQEAMKRAGIKPEN